MPNSPIAGKSHRGPFDEAFCRVVDWGIQSGFIGTETPDERYTDWGKRLMSRAQQKQAARTAALAPTKQGVSYD